jgi:hypothetical protein
MKLNMYFSITVDIVQSIYGKHQHNCNIIFFLILCEKHKFYQKLTILHQCNRGRLSVCDLRRLSGVKTSAILSVEILLMLSHFR